MDDIKISSMQNISDLERHFREKLYELQNNTDALRAMQRELLDTRHVLYSTELLLEKERTVSRELRMQLKAITGAMNELQQQQTKNQVESIQLQVKYDAISKQYDSLMSQTTAMKIQETEYKMKVQALEKNLSRKDMTNKSLEQTLKEFERNSSQSLIAIDHNIATLKREHQYLQKSCEAIVGLNQRLQVVGLCTYARHQKDNEKIKNLECTLTSLSIKNVESVNSDNRSSIKNS